MKQEIKRDPSGSADYSGSNDSIRRRSSNFPPPPPPPLSTMSDKGSNGYGPLISTNGHRVSLTTGKQSSLSTLVEGDV